MASRYRVRLSDDERAELRALLKKGTVRVRKLKRAQILLAAADDVADATIAQTVQVSPATIHRTRQRFVEGGLDWALTERKRPGAKRKLGAKQEASLIALACSKPPAGRQEWTMQLLADQLVTLEVVGTISDETVRRTLKKTS